MFLKQASVNEHSDSLYYNMKYVVFIFTVVVILANIKCHVTNRTKNEDTLKTIQTGNDTTMNLPELESLKDEKREFSKVVTNEDSRVYLNDVLYALKNQNWTSEEETCFNDTVRLLKSLQNFTMWAVWDWDSISSEPQGLLFGNRYQLGNFDECMDPPWFKTHPELRTQYCLAEIVLERTDNAVKKKIVDSTEPYQSALDFMQHRPPHSRPLNELTWGACVPATCRPISVERLLITMLARSHLGAAGMHSRISVTETCQRVDEPREFDAVFYSFIVFIAALSGISLICTCVNSKIHDTNSKSTRNDIIKSFCLRENAKDLLKMKKDGIEVLYGIRFLTITFIVIGHQIGMFNSGPISNGLQVDQGVLSTPGMLLLHDDLFVDTFFLLSGFLTATTLTKFKKFPNPFFIIIKRYIRLVIALAVVIFYICAVYPYTGSGPLWPRAIASDTEPCRQNWWLSLLMINNYVENENICIVISWYIPCDFHFFVITVLMYWTYKRYPRFALTTVGVITISSILIPGIINYVNKLPAVQLFTYEFITNPRGSRQFHVTYIKSHTRFAAYIVGFFSGYIFAYYSVTGNIRRISQKWSVLGTCSGLTIMLVVMVIGTTFLWRSYSPLEGAVYAALDRPVWACGVAMLVLCCSLGHVPFIKTFLSWYPWVPLSRLSYGLYLTHTVYIFRNVFVTRNSQHNDYVQQLFSSAGVIFWGCIAALFIWLLAEAPANNLLAICLKSNVKQSEFKVNENDAVKNASVSNTESNWRGHLQDNLPSTVYISSKI